MFYFYLLLTKVFLLIIVRVCGLYQVHARHGTDAPRPRPRARRLRAPSLRGRAVQAGSIDQAAKLDPAGLKAPPGRFQSLICENHTQRCFQLEPLVYEPRATRGIRGFSGTRCSVGRGD